MGIRFGRRLTELEVDSYTLLAAEDARKVRLLTTPPVPGIFDGITLGYWIFLCTKEPKNGTSKLIAHELVHVRQWKEVGTAGFLCKYLSDFVKGIKQQKNLRKAYQMIPFECQAREEADCWKKE